MNLKNQPLFSGFAGVALADILANSVAVLIIMIVTVILIKHEQEQTKIDQTEEVAVLLSRKIASSVVMNALPTSAPARLHDYKTSRIDINPQHSIMPILELHQDYVRNFYTGEKFSRDELLLPENRLDTYLRRLAPHQLSLMRVDLYHIRLFYIVMSILKAHDHYPRHWHFLTYPEGSEPPSKGDTSTQSEKQKDEEEQDTEQGQPSMAAAGKTAETTADELNTDSNENPEIDNAALNGKIQSPKNASLSLKAKGDTDYPYNDLAFEASGKQDMETVQDPSDLPGSSEQKSEQQETSDAVFDALSQMLTEDGQQSFQESGTGRSRLTRFRSAAAGSQDSNDKQSKNNPAAAVFQMPKQVDLATLLRALFNFMEQVQTTVDAGNSYNLSEYNFSSDVINLINQLPPERDPKVIAFFYALARIINSVPADMQDQIRVNTERNPAVRGKVIKVPINQRIQHSILASGAQQETDENLPSTVMLTSRASIYPEIYKGMRLPLKKDALILIPDKSQSPTYQFSWKIATFVSPGADDFVTAFLYAAFDEQGNLLIATDENGIKISNLRVDSNYPPLPLRKEKWQIFLYGFIAILVALSILIRFRKIS